MVLLCGFIRAYFARVRGVVCLVVFRAFVRLWRRSVPVVACGGLWWRYAFRVTVCRCGRCGRSSRWCGGVSVSVRGGAVRSCFHVPAVRAYVCARARVYALASCIRAPAYTRRVFFGEKKVWGVIPPFRVQKNFIGVKMWVCEKALTSAI